MGVIAVAVGIGGPLALFAAALHLVAHALGKSVLFFAAGTVAHRYQTRTLARIRGAAGVVPVSGTVLLLGGLALAGAPPSALFATELSILAAGFERGQAFAAAALLVCLALIFVGLLYHLGGLALGRRPPSMVAHGEQPIGIALVGIPLLVVAGLGLVVPAPLGEALRQATAVLGGG